jgi:hypothetical protein
MLLLAGAKGKLSLWMNFERLCFIIAIKPAALRALSHITSDLAEVFFSLVEWLCKAKAEILCKA